MKSPSKSLLNPAKIIQELTNLPHRGATTSQEKQAAEILQQILRNLGANVERQSFKTHKTYLPEIWWLLSGIIIGLVLIPHVNWFAFGLILLSVLTALAYFDWRATPISLFPPRSISENIISRVPAITHLQDDSTSIPKKKIILMAHYDTAPISFLYRPAMVKNFHQSLLINLVLMILTTAVAALDILNIGEPFVTWLRWIFIIYFIAQGILSSIDYLRYGFTNGASDNATGVAIAVCTAERLWKNPLPGWEIELVLTGAEEATMKGARHYFVTHKKKLTSQQTYLLNFDNLGAGKLKIITRTGTIVPVIYDNPLVAAAVDIAASETQFENIKPGTWHTGDFDSIWFTRAGIPSLTLSAQDDQGLIPHLHRPEDIYQNVDINLPGFVVDFAEKIIRKLANSA